MRRSIPILLTLLLLLPSARAAEGAGPRVAVLDTGISTRAISQENLLPGRNYVLPDGGTEDLRGHGTAVAGIIAGSPRAKKEGLCPGALLVPLVWSTLDGEGEPLQGGADMAARAIRDAIDVYQCRIVNLSLGTCADDPALREAVEYAEEKGVLLVAAAGNGGEDARPCYPGAYDTVLCVGCVDGEGAVSDFSQRGDWVDLTAPGEDLRVVSRRGRTVRVWGTSYAAGCVTGAAARLLARDPSLTAAQLRELLTASARDAGAPGFDPDYGWGILDPDAALRELEEWTKTASGAQGSGAGFYADTPLVKSLDSSLGDDL